MLTNEVAVNLYVLSSLMEDSILGNSNGTGVICIKRSGAFEKNAKFSKGRQSQTISLLAEDIERYSASTVDLERVLCFLLIHEISDVPKNMHQPNVDLRVSGHPTQSASA